VIAPDMGHILYVKKGAAIEGGQGWQPLRDRLSASLRKPPVKKPIPKKEENTLFLARICELDAQLS